MKPQPQNTQLAVDFLFHCTARKQKTGVFLGCANVDRDEKQQITTPATKTMIQLLDKRD